MVLSQTEIEHGDSPIVGHSLDLPRFSGQFLTSGWKPLRGIFLRIS